MLVFEISMMHTISDRSFCLFFFVFYIGALLTLFWRFFVLFSAFGAFVIRSFEFFDLYFDLIFSELESNPKHQPLIEAPLFPHLKQLFFPASFLTFSKLLNSNLILAPKLSVNNFCLI